MTMTAVLTGLNYIPLRLFFRKWAALLVRLARRDNPLENLAFLLQHGLIYGLLLSLLLVLLIGISVYINPEIWAGDYPPDIKARFVPSRPETRKQRRITGLAFLVVLIGIMAISLWQLSRALGGLTFWPAFLVAFTMLLVFNLVDLLVLDWLFFNTLQPKFIILPGTEGMAGYKDYAFHFRGFLVGLVFCLAGGLVTAGVAVLIDLL